MPFDALKLSLVAWRDTLEIVLAYVPLHQRENARAAALAIGIGYAIEADHKPKRKAKSDARPVG